LLRRALPDHRAHIRRRLDRGLIDAAAALQHFTREPALDRIGPLHRYHRRVFFTPPWPEIYATDAERRHDLDAAIAEYDRLLSTYPSLGYHVIPLPKVGVAERADFILQTLEQSTVVPGNGAADRRARVRRRPLT